MGGVIRTAGGYWNSKWSIDEFMFLSGVDMGYVLNFRSEPSFCQRWNCESSVELRGLMLGLDLRYFEDDNNKSIKDDRKG